MMPARRLVAEIVNDAERQHHTGNNKNVQGQSMKTDRQTMQEIRRLLDARSAIKTSELPNRRLPLCRTIR